MASSTSRPLPPHSGFKTAPPTPARPRPTWPRRPPGTRAKVSPRGRPRGRSHLLPAQGRPRGRRARGRGVGNAPIGPCPHVTRWVRRAPQAGGAAAAPVHEGARVPSPPPVVPAPPGPPGQSPPRPLGAGARGALCRRVGGRPRASSPPALGTAAAQPGGPPPSPCRRVPGPFAWRPLRRERGPGGYHVPGPSPGRLLFPLASHRTPLAGRGDPLPFLGARETSYPEFILPRVPPRIWLYPR